MKQIRAALIQMKVGTELVKNLENASKHIAKAKESGAGLVSLPECFNSPYGTNFFKQYAEGIPKGSTCDMLSKAAKENSIYLIGGTFPEIENGKYYNTCTVWNPEGNLIAKYRKMHLFDIDIPGKVTFKESDILSPGNEFTTFNIDDIKVGLGICYDLRFEELAKIYRLEGCKLLVYPAAFTTTTGPLHFELLQKARAVDNQLFVCGISPSRNEKGFRAYGYSQVTNPWGKVLVQAKEDEDIVYADIDFSECDEVRANIPIFNQRRTDIYDVKKI
ncbi:omega-amidase NIT2 isoform X2 [Diorhabda carinulata]|nr:omega-amidase NIT2-like [Diorhabda sublineata]XP_056631942.1 omega-amidase NIT2-like [Diorhabda sublineata]XP_057662003.1 omega-amidase NIT2 isoform X2 [Diorhabda carinulata]